MVESCYKRLPYASAVATILTCVGVGLFCAFFYEGVSDTQRILSAKFGMRLRVEWAAVLKLALVVAAAVMGAFSVVLLVFGCSATGATRLNWYSKESRAVSGRRCATVLLILTYLFNIVWTLAVSLLSIPIIMLVMMRSICTVEFTNARHQAGEGGVNIFCLDLARFGLYFANGTDVAPPAVRDSSPVCYTNDLRDICSWVNRDIPLYSVAFGGCYLIVLGLVTFLMTMGTNYQRIKSTKEVAEFRRTIDGNSFELDRMITSSSSRPTAF